MVPLFDLGEGYYFIPDHPTSLVFILPYFLTLGMNLHEFPLAIFQ